MLRPIQAGLRRLPDEVLRDRITSAQPGWQQAYSTLMHERHGQIIRNALDWVNQRHGSTLSWEEVTEQLFLNLYGPEGAWKGLVSWHPEKGPFKGWLWMVVRNACYRLIRMAEREPPTESIHPTTGSTNEHSPHHPVDPAPSVDSMITLNRLLKQLGDECAQLIRWKYFHGLSDTDVGQRKGVGREWVNRMRRRCEKELGALMHREGLQISDFDF